MYFNIVLLKYAHVLAKLRFLLGSSASKQYSSVFNIAKIFSFNCLSSFNYLSSLIALVVLIT